ncbi:MAG TPA: DUF2269 family protein [Actinomycetota bacterium]|nr:DUF2269 family protein [Actinomycetota bacterium]
MDLFTFLLLVHIAGAIIGFGPTFTFAVLGPLAGKMGGPPGLGIMEGMLAVANRLILPVSAFTQPVSGAWLIFEGGWNQNFFEHDWLWTAIVLYVIAFYVAVFMSRPTLHKMVDMAKGGQAGSAEFAALAARAKKLGPVTTLLLLAIIFLMVVKPGS